MKEILLKDWKFIMLSHGSVKKHGYNPVVIEELQNPPCGDSLVGKKSIKASVPGNFELDLHREGFIDDPFFGTNILKLTELEDRHLWYYTEFDFSGSEEGLCIRFAGIDTISEIYLNGKLLGKTDNMYLEYEFVLSGLKKKGNQLIVHILPCVIYAQKLELPASAGAMKYNYGSLYLRKAPSSFGWDIMPRTVSAGIWKPVSLFVRRSPEIKNLFMYTTRIDLEKDFAVLHLYYSVDTGEELTTGYKIKVRGVCGDSVFETMSDLWHTCGNITVRVDNPLLWYPRYYGEPNLYDVTVILLKDGKTVDESKLRTGIRTVKLDRTSITDSDGNGEFVFLINHKKVFVMGTNWVPLDAFHSRDTERLGKALELLADIGCNAVRCWGGNVYESEEFFDFCDEKGIMVWQDFAMGCAIYPLDNMMCDAIKKEVEAVVKRLRNHPSLCLWAGDNECDMAFYDWHGIQRDPNKNKITREIIPNLLNLHDFTRPYLPSSPYYDEEACRVGVNRASEDHLWGPRDYFKGDFYKNSVCHFASEIGYHGCPSPTSLERFIPGDELWPIYDKGTAEKPFEGKPHDSYLAHQTSMELTENSPFGYRISLMTRQLQNIFRDIPADLDEYAKMSQISQAEAKKYFIEKFRISKWRRTGIIWWNLLDGWPQISDSVVGYDFSRKLAYFFIRRVQQPVLLSFDEPVGDKMTLYAINETRKDLKITYRVRDISDCSSVEGAPMICSGEVTALADSSTESESILAEGMRERFLFIEWESEQGKGCNHFVLSPVKLDFVRYLRSLKLIKFDEWDGFKG